MNKQTTLILLVVLLLTGCVSAPPMKTPPTSSVVGDKARIILTRSTDFLYLALDARVFVNGSVVSALPRGGSTYTDVPSGPVTISVDHPTAPGMFTISFVTKAGNSYGATVSPRDESFGVGAMFGAAGLAVEASPNNGGLFRVDLVSVSEGRNHARNKTLKTIDSKEIITTDSIRERLIDLKALKDEGLIDEDVYKEQQKTILGQ